MAVPELAGNQAVEAAAIGWVMELERAGREPHNTRYVGASVDALLLAGGICWSPPPYTRLDCVPVEPRKGKEGANS